MARDRAVITRGTPVRKPSLTSHLVDKNDQINKSPNVVPPSRMDGRELDDIWAALPWSIRRKGPHPGTREWKVWMASGAFVRDLPHHFNEGKWTWFGGLSLARAGMAPELSAAILERAIRAWADSLAAREGMHVLVAFGIEGLDSRPHAQVLVALPSANSALTRRAVRNDQRDRDSNHTRPRETETSIHGRLQNRSLERSVRCADGERLWPKGFARIRRFVDGMGGELYITKEGRHGHMFGCPRVSACRRASGCRRKPQRLDP